jgi:hypothetical protein
MDNQSIQKIQKDLKKSKAIIIKSDDTSTHIKEKFGNKYLDDISDSDIDESMSYRKRNNNIINRLPDKNNLNIKEKMNGDNLSIKSLSVKKAPLRSTIKDNIKILEEVEKKEVNEGNGDEDGDVDGDVDEDGDSVEEYEFQEDFENQVKTYVKTDNNIKELQKEIKELNQAKKVAEDSIMKHLERLGETNINITGGKLIVNKYESKGSFKEDIVKEVLSEKIKDPKIVESIFDKIQEIRTENAKMQLGLKRTSGKKK